MNISRLQTLAAALLELHGIDQYWFGSPSPATPDGLTILEGPKGPRVFELKPLADLVLRFCSGLKEKTVELFNLIEQELLVRADEGRIEQVLYNLIGYAVTRTRQGSVIVRSQREAERVVISVSDWGGHEAGMQADASPEGLDLPIAKRLLELHGTSLVIESNHGKGKHNRYPARRVCRRRHDHTRI